MGKAPAEYFFCPNITSLSAAGSNTITSVDIQGSFITHLDLHSQAFNGKNIKLGNITIESFSFACREQNETIDKTSWGLSSLTYLNLSNCGITYTITRNDTNAGEITLKYKIGSGFNRSSQFVYHELAKGHWMGIPTETHTTITYPNSKGSSSSEGSVSKSFNDLDLNYGDTNSIIFGAWTDICVEANDKMIVYPFG